MDSWFPLVFGGLSSGAITVYSQAIPDWARGSRSCRLCPDPPTLFLSISLLVDTVRRLSLLLLPALPPESAVSPGALVPCGGEW